MHSKGMLYRHAPMEKASDGWPKAQEELKIQSQLQYIFHIRIKVVLIYLCKTAWLIALDGGFEPNFQPTM